MPPSQGGCPSSNLGRFIKRNRFESLATSWLSPEQVRGSNLGRFIKTQGLWSSGKIQGSGQDAKNLVTGVRSSATPSHLEQRLQNNSGITSFLQIKRNNNFLETFMTLVIQNFKRQTFRNNNHITLSRNKRIL